MIIELMNNKIIKLMIENTRNKPGTSNDAVFKWSETSINV